MLFRLDFGPLGIVDRQSRSIYRVLGVNVMAFAGCKIEVAESLAVYHRAWIISV
jgi:hypothetical protein